ncbi:MAG: hypothetical protein ACJ74Y_04305 [Bryobacteraceae bacterium]
MTEQIEVAEGFEYELNAEMITLSETAEWITMERLCCPFLTFQLDVAGNGDPHLTLGGPSGAKALFGKNFPRLNEVAGKPTNQSAPPHL